MKNQIFNSFNSDFDINHYNILKNFWWYEEIEKFVL